MPPNSKSDGMLSVWTIEDLRDSSPDRLPAEVRLAVLGSPIHHSLSPEMQNAGLTARALPFRYERLWIKGGELAEAFSLLRKREFIGWNLTIPHKVAACELVDEIDPAAARVGAINTVVNRSGTLVGFNTDGFGLITALRESFSVDFSDVRIAVLGAGGGAGMTASIFLFDQDPRQLLLVNRTLTKLDRLRNTIGNDVRVSFWSWEQLAEVFAQADLIINATSIGLGENAPALDSHWLSQRHRLFDMMYSPEPTFFLSWARSAGVVAFDGSLMLLHQGTEAFRHWFGPPVPEKAMRETLFRLLNSKFLDTRC